MGLNSPLGLRAGLDYGEESGQSRFLAEDNVIWGNGGYGGHDGKKHILKKQKKQKA